MRIVALVPIKLNSERVPHKNILPLGDKPLCYWLISTLLQVKDIDEVYVYCSDEKVKEYIPTGSRFLKRSEKLDGNTVKGKDIYNAFINEIDADVYVLAHTTSPFTKVKTVQNALEKVISGGHDSAFSAERVQTFSWYQGKPINYSLEDVPRTQDMEPVYVETSGFYIFKKEIWTQHGRRIGFNPYIQQVDSIEAVDIDNMDQYHLAQAVVESGIWNND